MNKIDPTKEYNISELVRYKVFRSINNRRAYKDFIIKNQKLLHQKLMELEKDLIIVLKDNTLLI